MYTLISAFGLKRQPNASWQNHDVADISGAQLLFNFVSLYLEIEDTQNQTTFHMLVEKNKELFINKQETVAQLVAGWWGTASITPVGFNTLQTRRATYSDAARLNYTAHRAKPGSTPTATIVEADRTELQLSRSATNMQSFNEKCMLTVNGFFYKAQAEKETLFVPEAGKSLLSTRMNHIGILSFENVGTLTTVDIIGADAKPQAIGGKLCDGIKLTQPVDDLTGKQVMLVLGGYLHLESDGVFQRVGGKQLVIRAPNIPIHDRYRESMNFVDWSSITGRTTKDQFLKTEMVMSDEFWVKMLDHPQTYWVVVDCDTLHRVTTPVNALPLPGQFLVPYEPTDLLTFGTGYCKEYWKRLEDGEWLMKCESALGGKPIADTIGKMKGNIASTDLPYRVYKSVNAHLCQIVAGKV